MYSDLFREKSVPGILFDVMLGGQPTQNMTLSPISLPPFS